jgi:hypothetical protein
MFLHISISWPLPTETRAGILRFMVEHDIPSSPEMILSRRASPDLLGRCEVQPHHRICRSVADRLKWLGLLAVNRVSKEWHIADMIVYGYAGH